MEKGVGFGARVAMDGRGGSRARPRLWLEKEGDPDEWAPLVSGWRSWAAYPFGAKRYWAGAESQAGPIWFPWHLFYFSLFLFPFSFSNFYLFHIICKNASKQSKPLSEVI
jgi:hypothetical protein